MTNITAGMVKDLRDKTGAGMMDCKGALAETAGDIEAAVLYPEDLRHLIAGVSTIAHYEVADAI